MKKQKRYLISVQFQAFTLEIRAPNAKEARKKGLLKLSKRPIGRLIDKQNTYVDED